MKLTAQVKLLPTEEQFTRLLRTLEAANAGCNALAAWAWEHQALGRWSLHKERYYALRAEFGLPAQVCIRAIAKVADAYKLGKTTQPRFRPHGSIAYDACLLTWREKQQFVTITTLAGRLKIPYVCGRRQALLLRFQKGETDLVYRDGEFYLVAVCEIAEPEPCEAQDALGIDMGIVNIAVDSDGNCYSGAAVNGIRKRHLRLRARLQRKQTRAAKRLLKRRRLKERRFVSDTNHRISKQLVSLAKGTNRAIALEDLQGIRSRTTVRRQQKATLHSWAFRQLRDYIGYKARRAGLPVFAVDPRYTSQRCSECGHTERANRPDQKTFCCKSCGFSALADLNAAWNIRILGRVELSAGHTRRAA